jgi:hypothetical protein
MLIARVPFDSVERFHLDNAGHPRFFPKIPNDENMAGPASRERLRAMPRPRESNSAWALSRRSRRPGLQSLTPSETPEVVRIATTISHESSTFQWGMRYNCGKPGRRLEWASKRRILSMTDDKLRKRIAIEAASLLLRRKETELPRARMRAMRALCRGYVPRDQFPSEAEIRDEIERQSYIHEGDARFDNLRQIRLAALEVMRSLKEFEPRLVGNVLDGDVRSGGRIELRIDSRFENQLTKLADAPDDEQHPDVPGGFVLEIDFTSGPSQAGATLEEFEDLLRRTYPDLDFEDAPLSVGLDRFQVYRMLLAPLAQVQQRKSSHPEGDVLYHSLQVFELAREELPYDEEFLLAALLHDVGKGIDPGDPVPAALNALDGYITPRTAWFIETLHDAGKLLDNSIGARARRRLHQHPDYDDLLLLARCDRKGRVSGGDAPTLDEALDHIRELTRIYG